MARRYVVCGSVVAMLASSCGPRAQLVKEEAVTNVDSKDEYVAEFAAECRSGLRAAQAALKKLLAAEPSLETTVAPYNYLVADLSQSMSIASLMRNVHPDKAIRDAATTCEQEAQSFATELSLNRQLYDAFSRVDTGALDSKAKRFVDDTLRDFRRSGVDKSEEVRERLKKIDEQLTKLSQSFSDNITEDVREIRVDPEKDLAGLPQDYIDNHKVGGDGLVAITTDYPDYIPFMNYAENDDLRKQLYILSKSRAKDVNDKVLREILTLRAEKAGLLGYAHWADYITEDKMIKKAANIAALIEGVAKSARSRSKREYAQLLAWKRKSQPEAAVVNDWEKSFLENQLREAEFDLDPQEVRPYLEYQKVRDGLLAITAKIYGLSYRKVEHAPAGSGSMLDSEPVRVWHPSVDVYDVVADNEVVGRVFLDMHPREGKYGHAAQFDLRTGLAGRQLPAGVLVCNFPDPSDGTALLEHDDVVTMFHEFGHLMHHVLGGNQPWITHSGVATEWDFVEAPSQMFEEWAWTHETLSLFARHHQTGEVLPKPMVDKMRAADKFGIGMGTMQQLFYASLSLNYHNTDPKELDLLGEMKRLQAEYSPFAYVPDTSFYSSFGHLTGYSAMYYTYMNSKVISKDLISYFDGKSLMDERANAAYRDAILAPGGSKDADVLIHDFLGRPFNFEAFEAYLRE